MNWVVVHEVEDGDPFRRLLNAADILKVSELNPKDYKLGRSMIRVVRGSSSDEVLCTEPFEQVVSQLSGYGVVVVTTVDRNAKPTVSFGVSGGVPAHG